MTWKTETENLGQEKQYVKHSEEQKNKNVEGKEVERQKNGCGGEQT